MNHFVLMSLILLPIVSAWVYRMQYAILSRASKVIYGYVALQRPKTMQKAEFFARMKNAINQRQGLSDDTGNNVIISTLRWVN